MNTREKAHAPIEFADKPASGSTTMKAWVANAYGSTDVLALTQVERPEPAGNEVLVEVFASSVTAADSMMRRGDPAYARLFLGLTKPRAAIGGTGFAGVVRKVGSQAEHLNVGDPVFGESGMQFGAHAQYVCVPVNGVILPKPDNLTFEDACALCDGPMTSYNFLKRMAQVKPGQKVLVNGASGALGTAAVQLAKAMGAEVTGVCSTSNLELVKSLGADFVVDYTSHDFTKNVSAYDFIYDTVGKSSYRRSKKALKNNGTYLSPVLSMPLLFQMIFTSIFGKKSAKFDATGLRPPAELRGFLGDLLKLYKAEKLRTVIEKRYPFDEMIEAHAHVDKGHKKGCVVVCMQ